ASCDFTWPPERDIVTERHPPRTATMAVRYQIDDPRWQTFYEVLSVESTADFTAIKKAYYLRAKQCHPDRHDGDPEMERQFKVVVAAFDVLSDPEKRQGYDMHMATQASQAETAAAGR